jgi:hypothetical protein
VASMKDVLSATPIATGAVGWLHAAQTASDAIRGSA